MDTQSKNIKSFIWVVAIVVLVGLIVWGNHSTNKAKEAAPSPVAAITDPSQLPGLQTGNAPWIAEIPNLKARLAAIGLPALPEEGTALHIHQHLDIYIDGVLTPVPPLIGINEDAGFISPIHVHDTTGIIHVESPTIQDFYLGQFFDIWGVKLTSDCIGGYCTSGDKTLQVFVNGTPYTGNPRDLVLASHQEIVITYGTPSELPTTIPSSFAFPDGY